MEKISQERQEWSDEDEDMLNSCISSIEEAKENRYAYKETDGDTSYDQEISWLKSLRNRIVWKPSEEYKVTIDLVKAEVKRLKGIAEKRMENIPPIKHSWTMDEECLKHMTRSREAKMDGLGGQIEAYTNVLSFLDAL